MERFDLSYKTPGDSDKSIVERLQLSPPESLAPLWDTKKNETNCREVAARFEFGSSIPAGLPTWFIARTHRFTTRQHWRYGALFADSPERKHLGFVEASTHARYIRLTVRGPYPHTFFRFWKMACG